MEINIIGIARVGVCAVSTLFCVLAMGLPSWSVMEEKGSGDTKTSQTSGLWKSCDDKDKCNSVGVSEAVLVLVALMVTFGVMLLIGALICALLQLTTAGNKSTVIYLGGTLAAVAGFLQLVAFAAYADYLTLKIDNVEEGSETTYTYGAAFGLDVVTMLFCIATAFLFFVPQLRATSTSTTTTSTTGSS